MTAKKPRAAGAVKPVISERSIPWLLAIDGEIRARRNTEYLKEAASDRLDGWALRSELDDLISRGFLKVIPTGEGCRGRGTDLCGNYFTVDLTDKALRTFWPEFVTPARRKP